MMAEPSSSQTQSQTLARPLPEPVEPLLLTSTRVATFDGARALTAASGFFFQREDRLFLITSRHVLFDPSIGHAPNRIELGLHQRGLDLTQQFTVPMWLYEQGTALWREARDAGGEVDVAALQLPADLLPKEALWHAFTPEHLLPRLDFVHVGQPLLVVGFPLGFHDTLHHLPVVRGAVVASAFGVRFQGQGCFVTDAPMHRGSSGAPVVRHHPQGNAELPWQLLGVHASRVDMRTRDQEIDAALGLNFAWYADVLMALTGS
jgi:Trypsin-like peptidase domain